MVERLDEPDLVVLARVVDRGSFARAAVDLGVPPSTLSRRVAALERRLGVRVLDRTTRSLRTTEIGELLAARGRRVRAELEDAERVVADHRHTPRGLLRLCVPTPANEFLGPVLAELLARAPELRLEVVASDGSLDLLGEGFDAVLHVGPVRASNSFGIVRLGHIAPVLAASTRYLERSPPLRRPHDLTHPAHAIVTYGRSRRVRRWEFVHANGGTTTVEVPASARALVTSKVLVAQLVAAGTGVALIPRTAALALPGVKILEPGGYRPASGPFSVVTPSARLTAPKVRAFIEIMKAFVATQTDLFT